MNLPGFSADATLYKTKVNYNTTSSHFGTAGSYAVLPQLPIGFCQANCDRIQDPFLRQVCELRCFEQTGGGGGGGQVLRDADRAILIQTRPLADIRPASNAIAILMISAARRLFA